MAVPSRPRAPPLHARFPSSEIARRPAARGTIAGKCLSSRGKNWWIWCDRGGLGSFGCSGGRGLWEVRRLLDTGNLADGWYRAWTGTTDDRHIRLRNRLAFPRRRDPDDSFPGSRQRAAGVERGCQVRRPCGTDRAGWVRRIQEPSWRRSAIPALLARTRTGEQFAAGQRQQSGLGQTGTARGLAGPPGVFGEANAAFVRQGPGGHPHGSGGAYGESEAGRGPGGPLAWRSAHRLGATCRLVESLGLAGGNRAAFNARSGLDAFLGPVWAWPEARAEALGFAGVEAGARGRRVSAPPRCSAPASRLQRYRGGARRARGS